MRTPLFKTGRRIGGRLEVGGDRLDRDREFTFKGVGEVVWKRGRGGGGGKGEREGEDE